MAQKVKKASQLFKERERIEFQDKDVMLVVVDDLKKLPVSETLVLDRVYAMLCTDGRIQLSINGKSFEVLKDDMLICPPNVCVDDMLLSPDFQFKMIGISYESLQRSLHVNKEVWDLMMYVVQNPLFHLSETDIQIIESYFNIAYLRLENSYTKFYQEVVYSLSQSLFYEILGIVSRFVVVQPSNIELNRAEQLFRKFLVLLTESAGRERTVSEFAQKLCITPKYLSTITKEASGKSAMAWIHEYTVDAIVQKLKYSDQTIKEIATELNFGNISFFGKFVKAHLGVPPKEYRRRLGRK